MKFWVIVLVSGLLDLFSELGAQTLDLAINIATHLDWLWPLLVVLSNFNTSLQPLMDLINFGYVYIFLFIFVRIIPQYSEFPPNLTSTGNQLIAAGLMSVVYLFSSMTYRGFPSFIPDFSPQTGWAIYFLLLNVIMVVLTIPIFIGMIEIAAPEAPLAQAEMGASVAVIFLITGGLATIATFDFGLAVIAIILAVIRLAQIDLESKISPESRLIQLVQLMDYGPQGFSVVIGILSGLFLATKGLGLVIVDGQIFPYLILRILPETEQGRNLIVILAIAIILILFAIVGFLQMLSVFKSINHLSAATLIGQWMMVGLIIGINLVINNEVLSIDLNNPVIYSAILASGVIVIGYIHSRIPRGVYLVSVVVLFGVLGPVFLQQSLSSSLGFLNLSVIGYWGGPLMERVGRVLEGEIADRLF